MRSFFRIVLLGCVLVLLAPRVALAQVAEEITLFDSNITVNQDTSLTILETIEYTTTLQKHGIYRYVPVSYNKDGVKEVLRISDIEVTDTDGSRIEYERSLQGAFVTLKIGDPDKTFTGDRTYQISYRVERAVNQFEDHNELYWDITGEGWKVPIREATATVTSEFASIEKIDCFTGKVGSSDGLCEFVFIPPLSGAM